MSIYIPENLTMVMKNAWWITVLRGLIVALLGLIVLLQPEISLILFLQFLGAYLVVDGIFVAFGAIRHRHSEPRWWVLLIRGLIGVVVGVFIFLNPLFSTVFSVTAVVYIVALLAVISGLLEILAAIRIRNEVSGEWTLVVAGIFSILLGLFLFAHPVTSLELLLMLVAIAAIVAGIASIVGGIRLRSSDAG